MIVPDIDRIGRHADGSKERPDFASRIACRAVGGATLGYINDDAAPGFGPPSICKRRDVGPLARREPAAAASDKNFDGFYAFLENDRVALSIVGRIFVLRDFRRLKAASQ